ncbi:MAG: hypothetical protein JWP89_2612 [Schlesneria sp.]|nr:hypothetical protein [Schlesneria sp.]
MIQISISFVDGSAQDMEKDDSFYHRLQQIRLHGTDDKSTITELLGDDWGLPLKGVRISGTLQDGTPIEEEYISR